MLVLEALRSWRYAKAQPTAAVRRGQSRRAVKLVLTSCACIAAMLLLVVPLLTLEADARGGGAAGTAAAAVEAGTAAATALADTVAGLAGTAAELASGHAAAVGSGRRMSAGRISAARMLRPVQSEVAVRSVPASRRRGSAARATGSPLPRPTRWGVRRHAWATPVAGCSATPPSPTGACHRHSARRASTAPS